MKKKFNQIMASICYVLGIVGFLYVAGYMLMIQPIQELLNAFTTNTLTLNQLIINILKIALSTTIGGFVWCVGYIGFNHFKGTEDPNWDEKNPKEPIE